VTSVKLFTAFIACSS